MTESERIIEILYQFEDAGLIYQDVNMVLQCVSDTVLGIGLGEQGVVKSKEDIRCVLEGTRKRDSSVKHTIQYEDIEVILHTELFASACAKVILISASEDGVRQKSSFYQMLSLIKQLGEWKICALHASTPVITEEDIEAYPLRIAEKTLESMRRKIGEEVYQAEEQYRREILADTIAFYVINLTQGVFEKSQLNGEGCAEVENGTPVEKFLTENTKDYVVEEDVEQFIRTFSRGNIKHAHENGVEELTCEYRLKLENGRYKWVISVLRMITDAENGDRKGIMYVRDISKIKRENAELMEKANRDSMTMLYNKETITCKVNRLLDKTESANAVFLMLDVDNFKYINDTFGHPAGDEVLIKLADVIGKSFGNKALAGRIGGDEFCVYIPNDDKNWKDALQSLWQGIAGIRLPNAPDFQISCSIGVAISQSGDKYFMDIYKKADKALYLSKKSGKGKISYFDESHFTEQMIKYN